MKLQIAGLLLALIGTLSVHSAQALPEMRIPRSSGAPGLETSVRQQTQSAQSALESRIGTALTAEQSAQLSMLVQAEQSTLQNVADDGHLYKSIYCVGVRGALGATLSGAGCVNLWSLKTYGLRTVGFGMAVDISASIFRLTVRYPSGPRFATDDPVPGNYGAVSYGLDLGLGFSVMRGDSGNKQVVSRGLNIGAGFDVVSGGILVIEHDGVVN